MAYIGARVSRVSVPHISQERRDMRHHTLGQLALGGIYAARRLPLKAAMLNGAAMIGKAKGMRQL